MNCNAAVFANNSSQTRNVIKHIMAQLETVAYCSSTSATSVNATAFAAAMLVDQTHIQKTC